MFVAEFPNQIYLYSLELDKTFMEHHRNSCPLKERFLFPMDKNKSLLAEGLSMTTRGGHVAVVVKYERPRLGLGR